MEELAQPLGIDDVTIDQCPTPIAAAYLRASECLDDAGLFHDGLLNLFETMLRYMSVIYIAQYLSCDQHSEQVNVVLKNLKRPSAGHWLQFLRTLQRFFSHTPDAVLLPEVVDFVERTRFRSESPVGTAYRAFGKYLKERVGSEVWKPGLKEIRLLDFFELMVAYRNAATHGARPHIRECAELNRTWLPALSEIIESAAFLRKWLLIFVLEVVKTRRETCQHKLLIARGPRLRRSVKMVELEEERAFRPQEVYLLPDQVSSSQPHLSLHPLLICEYCRICGYEQVFFANPDGRVIRYFSPACGHQFEPKQYAEDFMKVLQMLGEDDSSVLMPSHIALAQDKTTKEESGVGEVYESPSSAASAELVYRSAVEKAYADGVLQDYERAALEFLRQSLQLSVEQAAKVEAAVRSTLVVPRAPDATKLTKPATLQLMTPASPKRAPTLFDQRHMCLRFFLEPDATEIDNVHVYEYYKSVFLIQGSDAFYRWRLRGKNASNSPSPFLREKVVGDTPMDVEEMKIQAINHLLNIPMKYRVIKDMDYEKVIDFYFPRPLQPGEVFDVEWSCVWLGEFKRRREYVFWPVENYPRGIEHFEAVLQVNSPLIFYELYAYNGIEFVLEAQQPELTVEDKLYTIIIVREHPANLLLLEFERS